MLYARLYDMTTFAGRAVDLREMLASLVELGFDAAAAYNAALARLVTPDLKQAFENFRHDHVAHIHELSLLLHELGADVPTGSSGALLCQTEDMINNLASDVEILMAMRSNESDINLAYERALDRDDLDARLAHLLQENWDREREHRNWLEEQLSLRGHANFDDDHHLDHFTRATSRGESAPHKPGTRP
jgi:rubrerythrin